MEMRFEHHDRQGALRVGHGVTADLSSDAFRFFTDDAGLELGSEVVVHVAWPFLLQNICPLELILKGSVMHAGVRGTVVKTRSYEFRTRGPRSFWEPEPESSISKVA
jgi:hypothetical protein